MRFSRVGIRWRLIYVYDALCPWCFAFTPVVRELASHFGKILDYEVLSGGMLRGDQVRVVGGSEEAERLRERYERIEEIAGIRFGNRFFESIARGERLFDSEPPAIALAAFREIVHEEVEDRDPGILEIDFAHRILRALFVEGEDLNSPALYRGLAAEFGIDGERFHAEATGPEARDRAIYNFTLARQLEADAYPRLYLQTAIDYFHLIARGYSNFDRVRGIVESILSEDGP